MEPSAAIHLALDGLEAVNLALSLAVAPGSLNSADDRLEISPQAIGESSQGAEARLGRSSNPMQHAIRVLRGDGFTKIKGQEPNRSNDWTVYCDLLEQKSVAVPTNGNSAFGLHVRMAACLGAMRSSLRFFDKERDPGLARQEET